MRSAASVVSFLLGNGLMIVAGAWCAMVYQQADIVEVMAHTLAIKSYFDPEELIIREEKLTLTMPVGAFLLGAEFASYSGNAGRDGQGLYAAVPAAAVAFSAVEVVCAAETVVAACC